MKRSQDPIVTEIEEFLAATGMSASAFGVEALNDPAFVRRLRGDDPNRPPLDCKASTLRRVREFMASYTAAEPRREKA